jgi:phospholipase/lecithinase/hemolysin
MEHLKHGHHQIYRHKKLESIGLDSKESAECSYCKLLYNSSSLATSKKYSGDSYTTTGFNVSFAQPNATNPLGNPISSSSPFGYTAVNGPGWVEQLTVKYNQSLIQTYNLAYGGATVDSALVAPYEPQVLSFRQQVNQEFFPYYVEVNNAQWTSKNSLFASFFGINDVGNSYYQTNATAIIQAVFNVYAGLIDELYHSGARNFLFLNVPPFNLSPEILSQNNSWASSYSDAAIQDFNDRLAALAYNVQYKYADTTVFLYDTHRAFSQVLAYPYAYSQTSGYLNTTAFCTAYQNGTPNLNTLDPSCGIPVNQYFWLNSLHPTYPMQDVMAQNIALQLEAVAGS